MSRTLAVLAAATLLCSLHAHGGQYRGPGSSIPPNPGGNSSGKQGASVAGSPTPSTSSGGSSGTSTTGGSGGTNTPTGPVARRGTGKVAMGFTESAPSEWQDWWEFHKDEFLDLKKQLFAEDFDYGDDPISRVGPRPEPARRSSDYEVQKFALGALEEVLAKPQLGRDLLSAALIGAARIGSSEIARKRIGSYLAHGDQELRESAALALGIQGDRRDVPLLLSLARGDAEARERTKRPEISYRTRAFACYGLGLALEHMKDPELRKRIADQLRELAFDRSVQRPDIRVAAMHGLRLFGPELVQGEDALLPKSFLLELLDFAQEEDLDPRVAAHAVSILGPLLGRNEKAPHRGVVIATLRQILEGRKHSELLHPSVILSWTSMLHPSNESEIRALLRYRRDGRSLAGRRLATIALGRIGGEHARAELYRALRSPRQLDHEKPWLSLALAVMDHEARKRDSSHEVDETVARAILDEFRASRSALRASAHALALGMMRYRPAAGPIGDRLREHSHEDEAAGYLALSLGLMREHRARTQLLELVRKSKRRDLTQMQGAIALALLGDVSIAQELSARLATGSGSVVVKSSLARSIGFLGDARSLPSLSALTRDDDAQVLARAFAAAALGIHCDRDALPWGSRIATGCNYLAGIGTLRNGSSGILDLL